MAHVKPLVQHKTAQPRRYKHPEINTRLDAFRQRYNLSIRAMADLCGGAAAGISKTAMHRLILGTGSKERVESLTPIVLDGLRQFLKARGKSKAEIDAELDGILDIRPMPFTLSEEEELSCSTWGPRLELFRKHYKLSYRELTTICKAEEAGISITTIYDHCRGKYKDIRHSSIIKSTLKHGLTEFLQGQERSHEQIEQELQLVFPKEDSMIANRATLPSDVVRYFGLRRDPFTGDPRSEEEVFTTPQLNQIAAKIEDAINYQGFLVVTGDIGSGKTILKRRTMRAVEKSGGKLKLLWPEFFEMERIHTGSIATFLLRSFGQTLPPDLVSRAVKIKDVLADASADGVRVAIGFDECHHLDDRVLTALKNFWELGSGGYDRYLGVVLFGQPQFEFRLREHKFREICERIEVVKMPPFTKCAYDYLKHRLRLAGGDIDKLFERKAIDILAKQVSTPLALGNLANTALMKTYMLGEKKVLAEFLNDPDEEPRVRAVRRS